MQKTPYMFVIGQKEQDAKQINVRSRKEGDLGAMDVTDVLEKLIDEISTKQY